MSTLILIVPCADTSCNPVTSFSALITISPLALAKAIPVVVMLELAWNDKSPLPETSCIPGGISVKSIVIPFEPCPEDNPIPVTSTVDPADLVTSPIAEAAAIPTAFSVAPKFKVPCSDVSGNP